MMRWATRMFRREWRQQVLIIVLLTVAVTAAVASVTAVSNTAPPENAERGSASALLRFDGAEPRELESALTAVRRRFPTAELVRHREVALPGSVDTIDFRAQDPRGAYGGELLALRRGAYPVDAGQVAVTDGVAELLRLELGSTLALDGARRTVVGIVENPRRLSDEFALVTPASAGAPDRVTVLLNASAGAVESLSESLRRSPAFAGSEFPGDDPTLDKLAMFAVATTFLLLASLVAAAGFAVVAQRRLRQLGMLAAMGATHKDLRLVLMTNGALAGALATAVGTVAGLALWLAAGPTFESVVDHRIDRFSAPWELIVLIAVLAILGATGAAWWPGHTAARIPVMLALSGRPPKPRPAHGAAIAATALIALGAGCLALSDRDSPPLIIAGIVATIIGCLLLGPAAIRVFGSIAGRLPVAQRLALRDLVRYQARSGAALAAVALALGIAATIVVIASAEQAKEAARPANLSYRQIRIHLGPPEFREAIPERARQGVDREAARVAQLAARLDASVVPLLKVYEPGERTLFEPTANTRVLMTVDPSRRSPGPMYTPEAQLFVATEATLRYLGIDPATVNPRTHFLVDRSVP
ncbi:MAG TPA: ABC transporter permease, partial [Solirubrobacter sp.]|nr:ABC transporter permease [Solirubrobacter sp.]